MKTVNRTKTVTILLLAVFLAAALCLTFFYSAQSRASEASLYGREGEIVAYAAAFACLEENEGKSKGKMIEKAQEYIDARDALMAKTDQYIMINYNKINKADKAYEELSAQSGKPYLTREEYEAQMTEEDQAAVAERNAHLEALEQSLCELEREYKVDQLPVLYYSLEELRGGLAESLEILDDFSHMYDDGAKPETKGYTREDFDRLCDERFAAEREVLEKLNADNNPDLYTYSVMLYKARIAHRVVT